ncbi:MAG: hypothetical protein AABX89_04880 [Candidatus Thermoplasmatota archaeon]
MFPFHSRADWYRKGSVGHTVAVADQATLLLNETDAATLHERRDAYATWARVRAVLFGLLLVGTVATAASGLVAALRLTTLATPLAAITASLAGLLSVAFALVNRHVNRLEANIWGVLALAALRRNL